MDQAVLWLSGMLGLSLLMPTPAQLADKKPSPETVKAALKTRLPKTKISNVDCTRLRGLCEVTAGDNLFYIDALARYLVIGRVYDMETRQDLTAARLLEMNPDMLIGGGARGRATDAVVGDGPPPSGQRAPLARTIDLGGLSNAGAIVWGRGGPKVTIFTDFHCSYCRALADSLEKMDVTVVERPISVLGSRDTANRVLCSRDRTAAVRAAYAQAPIASKGNCDTRGLDENERFAKTHGFTGTPVIVRSDGAVIEGYRPAAFLANWIKGARA